MARVFISVSFIISWCLPVFGISEEVSLGQAKYHASCVACHGDKGQGIGVFPALVRLESIEIVQKLNRYRRKESLGHMSSIMWSISDKLTNQEIKDLADYIPTLRTPKKLDKSFQ